MSEPTPQRPPQVLRPVFLNDITGVVVPLSATVNINPRLDSQSGEYVILWNDIKTVINNPLHLWDGETPVPFLKDKNSEFLQPLRIAEYPGTILDVVLKAPEIDTAMQSLMIRFLETGSSTKPMPSDHQQPSAMESGDPNTTTATDGSQARAKRSQDSHKSCDDTQQINKGNCTGFSGGGRMDTQGIAKDAQRIEKYTQGAMKGAQIVVEDTQGAVADTQGVAADTQGVVEDTQTIEQNTRGVEERIVNINYGRGLVHYDGSYGAQQDFRLAAEYFLKAASQGHADAQHKLGLMYDRGQGVSQDYSKAAEWYQRAADQGHHDSQNNLGFLYESGLGVPMDLSKAVGWWEKAFARV
ncbi:hypothetical protein BGX21_007149 [Mortierella sp. AD011]|nr:hypothetical protein BGX20_007270 [Mortierella sp. AD010]KAF9398874.1 hypothetical protein BGX21_007149 [Mortierella sp. AD011]